MAGPDDPSNFLKMKLDMRVNIQRQIPVDRCSAPIIRRIDRPEDIVIVRRPGEGKQPLFAFITELMNQKVERREVVIVKEETSSIVKEETSPSNSKSRLPRESPTRSKTKISIVRSARPTEKKIAPACASPNRRERREAEGERSQRDRSLSRRTSPSPIRRERREPDGDRSQRERSPARRVKRRSSSVESGGSPHKQHRKIDKERHLSKTSDREREQDQERDKKKRKREGEPRERRREKERERERGKSFSWRISERDSGKEGENDKNKAKDSKDEYRNGGDHDDKNKAKDSRDKNRNGGDQDDNSASTSWNSARSTFRGEMMGRGFRAPLRPMVRPPPPGYMPPMGPGMPPFRPAYHGPHGPHFPRPMRPPGPGSYPMPRMRPPMY